MKGRWGVIAVALAWAVGTVPAAADATETGSTHTAKIKAAGISLQYPSTWTAFATTKRDRTAQEKALAQKDPRLARRLATDAAAAFGPLTLAKFHAENLALSHPGSESVNVDVQPNGHFPSSLQEFDAFTRKSESRPGNTVVSTSAVNLGDRIAYRSEVEFGRGDTRMRLGVLLFQRGNDIVDVGVLVPAQSDSGKVVDHILSSVHSL